MSKESGERVSDIPHPVGVFAPGLVVGSLDGFLEEEGKVDVGGGVEVASDFVSGVDKAHFLEHFGLVVADAAAVLGMVVEVERVVRCLRKLAIAQNLLAQSSIQRVQQPFPVVGAVDLAPSPGEVAGCRLTRDACVAGCFRRHLRCRTAVGYAYWTDVSLGMMLLGIEGGCW